MMIDNEGQNTSAIFINGEGNRVRNQCLEDFLRLLRKTVGLFETLQNPKFKIENPNFGTFCYFNSLPMQFKF